MDRLGESEELVYEWLNLERISVMDIKSISTLESELFGAGAWSEHAVQEELQAPSRYYIVARRWRKTSDELFSGEAGKGSADEIIGYAGIWFDGDDAQVMTIGVSESYQGRHVGTRLMTELKRKAEDLGAARLLLEVATDNMPALEVYRAAGFERIGLRKRYYQPENKDAYVMACVLSRGDSAYGNPVGFSVPE